MIKNSIPYVVVFLVITGSIISFIFFPAVIVPAGKTANTVFETNRYEVGEIGFTLIDKTRNTDSFNDFSGQNYRELAGQVWFPLATPENNKSRFPLIIYSHGFMSFHQEAAYFASFMAARGYVVVAADFPSTNFFAPGGPNVADVVNQPGDVSFLIDRAVRGELAVGVPDVDAERIAAAGLSLGGMTTHLVTYHPKMRDPRVAAAISIGGPSSMFTSQFFGTTDTSMLAIMGDIDAMIHYDLHAKPLTTKNDHLVLATVKGASHTGFADIASKPLRFLENPDSIGCGQVLQHIDASKNPFADLFNEADGVFFDDTTIRLPCDMELVPATQPGLQQSITALASWTFLEQALILHNRTNTFQKSVDDLAVLGDEIEQLSIQVPLAR